MYLLTTCIFYVFNLAIIIKGRTVITIFKHEFIESWRISTTCLGLGSYIPEQALKPQLKNCTSSYTKHYLFWNITCYLSSLFKICFAYHLLLRFNTGNLQFLEGFFVTTLLGRYSLPVMVCLNKQNKIKETIPFISLKWLAQYHAHIGCLLVMP